jgi:hypothetical protein
VSWTSSDTTVITMPSTAAVIPASPDSASEISVGSKRT